MEKILMATDGSASAHEAVGVGVELAAEHGAEVTFIHVFPADNYVIAARLGPALPKPDEVDTDENEVACARPPTWLTPPASPTYWSASRVTPSTRSSRRPIRWTPT